MRHAIATQLIGHYLPRFASMTSQQAPEETFSRSPIPLGLQIDINHFAILINSSPQIVLLTVDPYEDFVDEECVAVISMLSLQSSSL